MSLPLDWWRWVKEQTMPYTFILSSCTCRLSRFVYTYEVLAEEREWRTKGRQRRTKNEKNISSLGSVQKTFLTDKKRTKLRSFGAATAIRAGYTRRWEAAAGRREVEFNIYGGWVHRSLRGMVTKGPAKQKKVSGRTPKATITPPNRYANLKQRTGETINKYCTPRARSSE